MSFAMEPQMSGVDFSPQTHALFGPSKRPIRVRKNALRHENGSLGADVLHLYGRRPAPARGPGGPSARLRLPRDVGLRAFIVPDGAGQDFGRGIPERVWLRRFGENHPEILSLRGELGEVREERDRLQEESDKATMMAVALVAALAFLAGRRYLRR